MTETRYMGIDPGKSGGWAVLRQDGMIYAVGKNCDVVALRDLLDFRDTRIMLEKVWSSPQMGVVGAFSFGESFGFLQGLLSGRYHEPHIVTPQKWQREMGLIQSGRTQGKGDSNKKNVNKALAEQLFPGKKITHAWADALLIAEYCRRIHT